MEVHECVSFILVRNNTVLLETRTKEKVSDPGAIAIPGGHMEMGETQHETLYRELEEELNIKPTSFVYLCSLYHPTSELQLIHYYIVKNWLGTIDSLEAESVDWYSILNAPVATQADRIALSEYERLKCQTIFNSNY
ncbi:NUDIX hydrolase [Vibrio hyugaensis]|uniref:8-oxo-dGTP diphosphatase n=1 Tax=Vibrio hyugaensis TaxID=1534743 RepID=A0ABQ5Y5D9_9VIBR|nr:NUDIX domain-containing protein [Vibrio hyugaensis]GLR04817.1 DNA mismatch repair protein MutT [Vibrio hyugaensis]